MSRFKAKPFFVSSLLSRRGFSSPLSSCSTPIATTKKLPKLRFLNRVHGDYRHRAVEEGQKVLREYLHATKSIPFVYAELIANNSLSSLNSLFSKTRFCSRTFAASFQMVLNYEPINDFEFFFESIGIDYRDVHRFLPRRTFFFSEDSTLLDAACALSQFGFPWNLIGKLCVEDHEILQNSPPALLEKLCGFKERYGFDNLCVVGIVLAFPCLLSSEGKLGCGVDQVFDGLKRVFVGFDIESCVEGNVDAWYKVCRKVRVFYDLGCEKKSVAELFCENKEHFLKCSEEVLTRKVEYYCRFGVDKVDVGMFLLQTPELLSLDVETPVISVLGFLEHFGLEGNKLQHVIKKCTHCLGRNGMASLPDVMKALDLHEWCFDKIKTSRGQLLATYAMSFPDEGTDIGFVNGWKRIEGTKYYLHSTSKLDFLKGIGFGENISTIKVLNQLRGVGKDLRERFDCLVLLGFEHSKLCLMVQSFPEVLCQRSEKLEEKVNFWCQEVGLSIGFLVASPKYLHYDLDNGIRRRYEICFWLRDLGLCTKYQSIPRMIASNEKGFVERLYKIHPAAPKHYFERF